MHNNVRARSLGYFTQVGITVTTATVVAAKAMAMATAVTNNELKVKRIKRNKRPNEERNAQRSSARNSVNLNRIKLSYKSRVYFFFVSTSFATFDSPCHTLSLFLALLFSIRLFWCSVHDALLFFPAFCDCIFLLVSCSCLSLRCIWKCSK